MPNPGSLPSVSYAKTGGAPRGDALYPLLSAMGVPMYEFFPKGDFAVPCSVNSDPWYLTAGLWDDFTSTAATRLTNVINGVKLRRHLFLMDNELVSPAFDPRKAFAYDYDTQGACDLNNTGGFDQYKETIRDNYLPNQIVAVEGELNLDNQWWGQWDLPDIVSRHSADYDAAYETLQNYHRAALDGAANPENIFLGLNGFARLVTESTNRSWMDPFISFASGWGYPIRFFVQFVDTAGTIMSTAQAIAHVSLIHELCAKYDVDSGICLFTAYKQLTDEEADEINPVTHDAMSFAMDLFGQGASSRQRFAPYTDPQYPRRWRLTG